MEPYIVSARKYRPATFDAMVGQGTITATLKNAIRNNQLAQAFLFCGPRGVGKTTCARILAKTINCSNITPNIEPCNECESCLSFSKSMSFNVHELDAASNNSVDDIRSLVDQVRIPPQIGRYKIYIIDEVHMLSTQAFNAFLKTLEEPPAYAKFILATTEKHKIIPTILSRCQIYDFKRISVEDIISYLTFVAEKEEIQTEPDALHIIARKADGALRDALSIFDQIVSFSGREVTYKKVIENLNVLDYDYYFKITDAIRKGDTTGTLLIINEIIDNGFDGQHFLAGFGEHLRNLLVCQHPDTYRLLEAGAGIRELYRKQARDCTPQFLLKALDINNKCDINYRTSNNKRLHVELALLQMCSSGSDARITPPPTAVKPQPGNPRYSGSAEHGQTIVSESRPMEAGMGKMRGPGTLSIRQETEEIQRNGTEKPPDAFEERSFTHSDLEKAWMEYAGITRKDQNMFTMLTKRKPLIVSGNEISFTVDNRIQEDDMKQRSTDLLGFLRKELHNHGIRLQVLVHEKPDQEKPYTPTERYRTMAEKNPALRDLKERLDLEIDY
ncbi:MAG: DNA polymerase III subunit gamma/tau [Bacteroidales bacterium]|nr:DNA polymerase III subunit gamma/tau [Bacteroidales bacterium]